MESFEHEFSQNEAVEESDSASLYAVARSYELGIGTEKSLENAIHYYELAAENGFITGYYKAGCCYKEMDGEENAKKAVAYFKMGATGNDPLAQFELAEAFKNGFGIEQSESEADRYYKLAESEIMRKREITFKYLKISADQGDTEAQYMIGYCYEKGEGVEPSWSQASKYYRLAAEKGSYVAQYLLGNLYKWGLGVEQSKEESLKYYELSADQEYGPALIEVADYYDSEEVQNYKKAFEYYKKAADQGYAEAQCDVGFHYKYGDGVDIDISKAIYYYQLAADQGDSRALCNLAKCYEAGTGVPKSSEEAFKYFKKAADQGSARGQFNVARCYRYGIGVEFSLENAIAYYELALAQEYKTDEILMQIQLFKNELNKIKQRKVGTQLARGSVTYPGAKKLDTSEYLKDRQPKVLKNILKQASDSAVYLKGHGWDEAEIQIIRDAMIENSKFIFICREMDLQHLYHSYEEIGYHPKSCLRCAKFKDKDLYRLLFIDEAA